MTISSIEITSDFPGQKTLRIKQEDGDIYCSDINFLSQDDKNIISAGSDGGISLTEEELKKKSLTDPKNAIDIPSQIPDNISDIMVWNRLTPLEITALEKHTVIKASGPKHFSIFIVYSKYDSEKFGSDSCPEEAVKKMLAKFLE